MAEGMLDIVDESDEIIGQALRSEIHANGLLHREVHIWFVTPNKEIIFQKRKPSPPMFMLPLLDATVGGHVELGDSYLKTAVKEIAEETGLSLKEEDLSFYKKTRATEIFKHLNKSNNIFRHVYLYKFGGDINALQVEEDKGRGFIAIPADDFTNRAEWIRKEFDIIPFLLQDEMNDLFKEIANV